MFIKLLTCVCLSLLIYNIDQACGLKDSLVFVHVLFRHGVRTPIDPYPTDPWKDRSNWPVPLGRLTDEGKEQLFNLGKVLRRRYNHLVDPEYNPNNIYCQSSDVDRTIMSASQFLNGFYAKPTDEWSIHHHGVTVPIHTIPMNVDNLILFHRFCAKYEIALSRHVNTAEFKNMEAKYNDMFEYLTRHAGRKISNFPGVRNLYSTLFIENYHNKTLPDWTSTVFPGGDMEYVAAQTEVVHSATPELAKLRAGFLIDNMMSHMANKANKKLKPNRNIWIYSGHDITVTAFLSALKIFNDRPVPFAACVMVELRMHNSSPYVSIYYKNTTETPREALKIPGCGDFCPLYRMLELYKDILPGSFEVECKVRKTGSPTIAGMRSRTEKNTGKFF